MPLAEHDVSLLKTLSAIISFNSRAPRGARPAPPAPADHCLRFQFTCPSRSTTAVSDALKVLPRMFQFTCPSRSTTFWQASQRYRVVVSIHVPLAEHDEAYRENSYPRGVSIHVPLAEHDICADMNGVSLYVSIHVPLAEHDPYHGKPVTIDGVSIHVPLAEHDDVQRVGTDIGIQFQFTCPSRSTTPKGLLYVQRLTFQFTCPSRSTTGTLRLCLSVPLFQFTCPSRSTTRASTGLTTSSRFQFTCPSRSTTASNLMMPQRTFVSIHVPLAEHDRTQGSQGCRRDCFNSRAPRGARRR